VTLGYAKVWAGTGVTVNSVLAGPTHTPGVEEFVGELVGDELPWDEARRQLMKEHRPYSLIGLQPGDGERAVEDAPLGRGVRIGRCVLCRPATTSRTAEPPASRRRLPPRRRRRPRWTDRSTGRLGRCP